MRRLSKVERIMRRGYTRAQAESLMAKVRRDRKRLRVGSRVRIHLENGYESTGTVTKVYKSDNVAVRDDRGEGNRAYTRALGEEVTKL